MREETDNRAFTSTRHMSRHQATAGATRLDNTHFIPHARPPPPSPLATTGHLQRELFDAICQLRGSCLCCLARRALLSSCAKETTSN